MTQEICNQDNIVLTLDLIIENQQKKLLTSSHPLVEVRDSGDILRMSHLFVAWCFVQITISLRLRPQKFSNIDVTLRCPTMFHQYKSDISQEVGLMFIVS